MSHVAGYFVLLTKGRYFSLETRFDEKFSEPVPEFSHSRYIPLICFIIDEEGIITHIGSGRRGVTAGTDLRKLNINDITKLNTVLSAKVIANYTSTRSRNYLLKKIETGGLISPKTFAEFVGILLKRAEEVVPILNTYSKDRNLRINMLSKSIKRSLAEQKEAVLTAINIAGIDKSHVQGWDYSEAKGPVSFLDGLEKVTLREDSMIINDLVNFPGFDLIKTTTYSASIFQNDKSRLTVILANRLPLEELLGTDLIYYNEDFGCFIMVQYKVMEKENDQFLFRVPNTQLTEDINRMESIVDSLNSIGTNDNINDFRFNHNPFFIKICPKIEFEPDNTGLSAGMYIPLVYLKLLQEHESIKGERGGRAISYKNIGRYFDNTSFKAIIEGGWIGTNTKQSKILEKIILNTLENGRTAVLSIKKNILEENNIGFNYDL